MAGGKCQRQMLVSVFGINISDCGIQAHMDCWEALQYVIFTKPSLLENEWLHLHSSYRGHFSGTVYFLPQFPRLYHGWLDLWPLQWSLMAWWGSLKILSCRGITPETLCRLLTVAVAIFKPGWHLYRHSHSLSLSLSLSLSQMFCFVLSSFNFIGRNLPCCATSNVLLCLCFLLDVSVSERDGCAGNLHWTNTGDFCLSVWIFDSGLQ